MGWEESAEAARTAAVLSSCSQKSSCISLRSTRRSCRYRSTDLCMSACRADEEHGAARLAARRQRRRARRGGPGSDGRRSARDAADRVPEPVRGARPVWCAACKTREAGLLCTRPCRVMWNACREDNPLTAVVHHACCSHQATCTCLTVNRLMSYPAIASSKLGVSASGQATVSQYLLIRFVSTFCLCEAYDMSHRR